MAKFTNLLAVNSHKIWKDHYISYSEIKQIIKSSAIAKSESQDTTIIIETFTKRLAEQLEKVNTFYCKMEKDFQSTFETLSIRVPKGEMPTPRGVSVQHQYLLQFSEQIEYLRDFVVLNTKAYTHLCSKFDKACGTHLYTELISKINTCYFYSSDELSKLENNVQNLVQSSVQNTNVSSHVNETVKPLVVEDFKVESLDRGLIHQIWVPLVTKQTGEKVSIPVLVARGIHSGPIMGIVCATRGNELNGISIAHRLIRSLDLKNLSGTVCAVLIANPPGFILKQTSYCDGIDLNEIFPGKANGDPAEIFAYKLLHSIIVQFEYVIDIHTSNFGRNRANYLETDTNDDTCKRMALLMNPQVILHETSKEGSLTCAARQLGIKSILIATGNPNSFQEKHVQVTLDGISRVLGFLRMYKYEELEVSVQQPTICMKIDWICSDTGGLVEVLVEPNHWVKQGDKIATIRSVFGHLIKEYTSPFDGIVVSVSTNPVNTTGSRILSIGRLKDDPIVRKVVEKKPKEENEE